MRHEGLQHLALSASGVFGWVALLIALFFPKAVFSAAPYTLGPGDKVRIVVYDNDDLTQEITLPPSGEFEFPFIGTLKAAGKTTTEIEHELTRRLGDGYLVNPQVRVTVVDYQSKKIHVMGAAKKPGTVVLRADTTLLELITQVEGPAPGFSGQIKVMREKAVADGKAEYETLLIKYNDLVGGDVKKNLLLQGGDYVVFESSLDSKENVNVTGAVRRPGIHPLTKDMTLLDAIVAAEGFTQDAADRVNVIRSRRNASGTGPGNAAGSEQAPEYTFERDKVMAGKVDFKLQNGDTIIIPRNEELDYRFFVLGEVKDPRDYTWKKGITVLQAISMAGGLTEYGTTRNIEVVPNVGGKSGKPKRVDLNYEVQPQDTIVVKEGWF